MNVKDCIVIEVKPCVECPMCCENILQENMSNSCSKNIHDHFICKKCLEKLNEQGFENKCVYCGSRSKHEENITVIPASNPNMNNFVFIQSQDMYYRHRFNICILCEFLAMVVGLFCVVILVFIFGVCMFTIGQLLLHDIRNENHYHQFEWTIRNSFLGYACWFTFIYILVILGIITSFINENYFKPCLKTCFKKIKYRIKNLCSFVC